MKNNSNQPSPPINTQHKHLQHDPPSNTKTHSIPQKLNQQKIFVQTPQALFIPINQKHDDNLLEFQNNFSPKEGTILNTNTNQNIQNKKINIFQPNLNINTKQNRQVSTFSALSFQKLQPSLSNVLKSKTSINLKKQRISEFFFYQNFIVCKGLRKVIVHNLFTKSLAHIPINEDEFILTPFAPYIFNCIIGQYLNLYSQNAVQKYMEVERKRQSQFRISQQNYKNSSPKNLQNQQTLNFRQNLQIQKSPQFSAIDVLIIKISKLEVQCICKHSQSFFMGGYNRSVLPGGKRSQRREVYEMEHLDPKINNKPKSVIKLQPSSHPVSIIQIQMPYLIVYCKPKFYLFGLKSHELLLTFSKEMKHSLLLQGRYAFNVVNGMGISFKNNKSTIFTFDLEQSPIYGVQITEHKQEASCLCLQKTGRIFGCHKSALFEYIPSKRITRCVKLYPQSECILWIESTPSNNLLVLRQTQKMYYVIEAFTIDQSTITDF